ncbi:MAG: hypothetical protein U0R44_02105 [Candidatus Micrarchaeia archaeon]
MKLKHSEIDGGNNRFVRRAFYAGAALMVGGLMLAGGLGHRSHNSMRVSMPEVAAATMDVKAQGCEMSEVQSKLEGRLMTEVLDHSAEIKRHVRSGSGNIFVNFSLAVDRSGNFHLMDAWTTPESDLNREEIQRITGVDFSGLNVRPPEDGTMCSISVPVRVPRES